MDYALAGGVILSGLVIVFGVLVLLTLILTVFGKLMGSGKGKPEKTVKKEAEQATEKPAPAAQVSRVAQPAVEDGIQEETVAVISASIAAVLGSRFAVRGVKRAHGHSGRGRRTAWGLAGMRQNTNPF